MSPLLSRSSRVALVGVLSLCAGLRAPDARADATDDANHALLTWCGANYTRYKQVIAETKQNPEVPTPPQVEPPCRPCNTSGPLKSDAQTQVDGWISYSQEPEISDINYLLMISKKRELMGENPASIYSAEALKCFKQFDQATIDAAIARSAKHLYDGKAYPMSQQFGSDRTRAFAGVQFLLAAAKTLALLAGIGGAEKIDPQQPIDLARSWIGKVVSNADSDILKGHKFNLCPSYVSLLAELELLGGESSDMDQLVKMIQRMDDELHFDIELTLHATGPQSAGTMDATWKLKSTMHVELEGKKECYTPRLDGNQDLQVSVENFQLVAPDGTQLSLTSPRSFTTPVAFVELTLCDKEPHFKLHVSSYGPLDELEVKGHPAKAGFFQGMWGAAVNAPLNQALITAAGAGSGSSGSSSTSSSGPGSTGSGGGGTLLTVDAGTRKFTLDTATQKRIDTAKATLMAHKTDPQWIMGPEGQAAIADMQSAVTQTEQSIGNSIGPGVGAGLAKADTVDMTWNNGDTQTVDQQWQVSAKGMKIDLHATVKQHPRR